VTGPLTVTEYTDPLCPWAWGSEPAIRRLRAMVGVVPWRVVYGMLFDVDDDPAPDPDAETSWYGRHLGEIADTTGAPFPGALERVPATSRPAIQASIAARAQGERAEPRVLRRLREVYVLTGQPPDTPERVRAALVDLPDVDVDRVCADAAGEAVREAVARDHAETRAPLPEAFAHLGSPPKETRDGYRYVLPTLRFDGPLGSALAPGRRTVADYVEAIRRIAPEHRLDTGPSGGFDRYPTLTGPEFTELTGSAALPDEVVAVPTAGGPLWMTRAEADRHPAVPAHKTYPDGN